MKRTLYAILALTYLLVGCNLTGESPTGVNLAGPDISLTKNIGGDPLAIEARVSMPTAGTETSYLWDFGDGTVRLGSAIERHVYAEPGDYTLSVEISDGSSSTTTMEAVAVRYDNPRPKRSPDVAIIATSGRCGVFCNPPFDNYTYLEEDAQTVQAVEDAFKSLGYSTETFNTSAFIDEHFSWLSWQYEKGYVDAEAYLDYVVKNWVADYDNPTRIVLLTHSHGTVWGSLMAWNHPEAVFDYFIYLDAICAVWPDDNMTNNTLIQDYYDPRGEPYPWPLDTVGSPCDAVAVPGLLYDQDINDVVPDNTTIGLEVRSENGFPNYLWDDDPNHRQDGSHDNIATIESIGEDHNDVIVRGSKAMNWVVDMIKTNGLPPYPGLSAASLSPQGSPDIQRIPAPEGYQYHRGE